MILNEPYNTWLNQNVASNIDENSRFVFKITAKNNDGVTDVDFSFDLVWFILIHVESGELMKLQVAQELLKIPKFKEAFDATLNNPVAKRLIEEFLLFNYIYLDGLKASIDFTKLDLPLDFVSHALFIKRSLEFETKEISSERLKIVNTILNTGFSLPANSASKDGGAVIRKVLSMDLIPERFNMVKRLLGVGFKLFSANQLSNAEISVALITARDNLDCMSIIQQHLADFKTIKLRVGDNNDGTLADYFYWVKEDMVTVQFVKETLGVELSPGA